MKIQHFYNYLFSTVLLFCCLSSLQAQIWSEDFNAYGNGTFNAPPKWTSNATDCDDPSINEPGESQWGVYNGAFTVTDIEGFPCCAGSGGGNDNTWMSEIIDLNGFCDISISMEVFATGTFECNDPGFPVFGCQGATPPDNSHDQVVAEYSLDGGAFTQFGYVCGDNGIGLLTVGGLNGATLQIRFSAACKSNSETYTIDNIAVNGLVGGAGTFDPIGPFCEIDPPFNLPTASLEGYTGSWDIGPVFDPAGLGGTTTTITFTPDPSFCAAQTMIPVIVNSEVNPFPDPIGPFCETDPVTPLQVNVGGITGTWNGPGVSNNEFDPSVAGVGFHTVSFVPDPNQCANGAGLLVEVTAPNDPFLGTTTLCDNDPPFDLTALEDPLYPGGSWTGMGVTGTLFDPTGLFGTITLTYIPTTSCTNIGTTDITVEMANLPVLLPATVCETAGLLDLTTLLDPTYVLGTWSGPGVAGDFFNPNGLPGSNVLTFTSSESCVAPATTTVLVELPAFPTLNAATVCESDPLFDLTTLEDPLYTGGTWIGPNVTGSMFDPSGLNGPINLTYTPTQACAQVSTTTITVEAPGTPSLGTASICESNGPLDLTTLQDPLFPNGTWSGPNVAGTLFDPTGQSGSVGVIFTPISTCAFPSTTLITVEVASTPDLGTATLCQNATPLDLTTLQDPDYPNGVWTGDGVTASTFDPDGLSGSIALTFTPVGNCIQPAITFVNVDIPGTPTLGTTTLCETEGLYNLTNISDPAYPAGTWSGMGVTGNNFDPDGLNGAITLTFTPTASCVLVSNTTITVNQPASPDLGTAAICQNNGLFDLNTLTDPSFPDGAWSGTGVTGNNFDPVGQSGNITLTFTPTANCTSSNTTEVSVNAAPTFSNQDENCDPNTQEFTVSFDIAGGTAPYTIDGLGITGSNYLSTSLPSGTNYSFTLDDANGCGPIVISGSANCNCSTDAGSMDFTSTPIVLCDQSDISVIHLGDEVLDGNDNLVYILHTNAGTNLGTVLSTSTTTTLAYPAGGAVLGQTYYVSAVAGNDAGNGSIDLTDPCLSVAQGIPVSFYLPTINMNQLDTMCANDCFDFTGTISGVAPFTVDYVIDSGASFLLDTTSGSSANIVVNFCPSSLNLTQGFLGFEALSITDATGCYNDDILPSSETTLYVNGTSTNNLTATLCPFEQVVVNGKIFDADNPTGSEIIPAGSLNGCDSIINIDLSFFTADTNFIAQTLCTGGSILVNGETYNESNPGGFETIVGGNVNGCDSTIAVDLTFNTEVLENLQPTLCPGGSIVVNGEVYDASNPVGSETFPDGSLLGCDSTVLINLSFFSAASANITPELCTGGSIVINGETYDEDNPSGSSTLTGASVNGCDSLINVNVVFTDAVSFNLTPTLCVGDSVIVNGNVYNSLNPVGVETITGGSALGCDSIINIALGFQPPITTLIDDQLCTGGFIIVNGNTYDESTPSGTELIAGSSSSGCDSLVIVDLNFSSEVFETLNPTLCGGESVIVNGNTYNQSTPTGMETFAGGSYLGCDSTVIIDLSFDTGNVVDFIETYCPGESVEINGNTYDEDTTDGQEIILGGTVNGCDSIIDVAIDFYFTPQGVFNQELCTGGSVVINGMVYDENNASGTETLTNASINGCDSTVAINLTFTNSVEFDLFEILCPGESITVNGEVYDVNNTTGSQTFPGGSVLGCDSTVNVELAFYLAAFGQIIDTLNAGESIVVNGTTYDQQNPGGVEIISGASVNGCDSTVIIDLQFVINQLSLEYESNPTSCDLGEDGTIIINAVNGGEPPYTIAVNGGNSEVVAVFPYLIENLQNGFYNITIIDAIGTIYTEEIFLPFPTAPVFDLGDDLFITLGETINLVATTDFTPASYLWEPATYLDCTDCEMPSGVPQEDIIYSLTVTDQNGCLFTDDIQVFVQKVQNVYAPTAFSPNNDARNDEFTLFAGAQVEKINSLLIFDRWGDQMFEQYNFAPNDLSIGWDGRYKGQMMNPGVYVWFAEITFLDGQVALYEGEVTLIR